MRKKQISKLSGQSLDITNNNIEAFKAVFPQAVKDGKIDFEVLKQALGKESIVNGERYGLSWAGKSECFRHIQETTSATLIPCEKESISFDTTENIFIEGDNLQVLKVLQKSYYGRIKMIYIDPPYNTGEDSFIYPDRFSESKESYLRRIGDKDAEGNLIKDGFWRKNSKDSGHFHSNWLSMMYPRLFYARNLLKDDGVIFVSVDDNEVHNLRAIMDEIFGEDNFEGHIHWRRRHNQPNDPTKMIALVAEHIIAYSKKKEKFKESGVGKVELTGSFSNPDNDTRGAWSSKPWKAGSDQSGTRYKITTPTGKVYDEEWMGEETTFEAFKRDNRIIFPDSGNGSPRKKYFESERQEEGQCATNWWPHDRFGHNQEASIELTELFDTKNVFSNPKPTKLIQSLIAISNCKKDDIVIDFFAGSCTTAHAVMLLNDGVKFICVQLTEPLKSDDKDQIIAHEFCITHKLLPNIAELGKERIRRAAKKIKEENEKKLDVKASKPDLGFKVFKLTDSNFTQWRSDIKTAKELAKQMSLFIDNVKPDSLQENILYEIILKTGLDLNVNIEAKKIDRKQCFFMDKGKLIVCLEKNITKAFIDRILELKPEKLICLDRAFESNDQLKTNTALQMESSKIEFKVI